MEGRNRWCRSQHLSCSAYLLILYLCRLQHSHPLNFSPFVSHTRLLSFNVISLLSPSHVPSPASPCSPVFHTLDFPLLFGPSLLTFPVSLSFNFSPFPVPSVLQISPLLFLFLILSFLLPGLSISFFLLRPCCRAPLAHTNFRLITVITSINERGLSS